MSETHASEWEEYTPPCDPPWIVWPARPCYTRIAEPIIGALKEFEMNGNESHTHIIILMTDGWYNYWIEDPRFYLLDPLLAAEFAKENRTRIYTLGISGRQGLNETILRPIANISGGGYKKIDDQYDFDGMYENISHFVDDTAARDPNPFDSVPMIEDMLPWYVHYVPGSFVDPATGDPRPPDLLISNPSGSEFKWFNRVLRVGETWSVSFNVTVAITGLISADIYPDSGVNYASWNWTNVSVPFPLTTILVLPPIHPPTNVTASLEGADHENVRIRWTLSINDPADIDHYDIYYGSTHHPNGIGYSLLGWVPKGFDSAVHTRGGEGDQDNYFYRVCAVASSGGSVCSSNQAAKFTRPLSSGPNLISIPLIQSNESIETVLQTVKYNKAWYYDSSSQEWNSYMNDKTYKGELWNIDHTMGLWINVTEDSNLTVAGMVPAQTTIHLQKGWNLVAFPSFNASFTVTDLKAATPIERVEAFDPSNPPHFLRVALGTDVLLAGEGYWLRTTEDTFWLVSNT